MKRALFPLILICLLLCGCAAQAPQEESTIPPTQAAQTTQPAGLYEAGSALELATNGAVRCYPLQSANSSVLFLEGKLLLFSSTETGTILTVLSGDTLSPAASLELDIVLNADALTLRPSDGSFSFFDPNAMETVVLDSSLREIRRIAAPEDMTGQPLLSSDRSTLYYCTADSLRALDLETGISRRLKEMSYSDQSVTGLWLEDTVLECRVSGDSGSMIQFLSTETGQTLGTASDLSAFSTSGDRYYALYPEGSAQICLFGTPEADAQVLTPLGGSCYFLPEDHAAVTVRSGASSVLLDYYDLDTGRRSSSLELPTTSCPWGFESAGDGLLYFLNYDESRGTDVLYHWNIRYSLTGDETIHTGPHYTRTNPDIDGLAACSLYAREISQHYGVEVLIHTDAAAFQPWDYDLEAEYLVPVIQAELKLLDAHLGNYPEGFLTTLADCFGGIRICIVRSITGSPESGSLEAVNGIQFWDDSYTAYLALAAGQDTEHTLYHELCHLIDTKVFNECSAYDNWDKLNPAGFAYDYDYTANLDRDPGEYLDEKRYFIDTYSMSFPKEDRARIMEYAMTSGNEAYFQSTPMQAKLLTLCQAIREAFGLKKSPDTFLWEQYLNVSLAHTE